MIVTKYSARVAATDILSAINPVLTSIQSRATIDNLTFDGSGDPLTQNVKSEFFDASGALMASSTTFTFVTYTYDSYDRVSTTPVSNAYSAEDHKSLLSTSSSSYYNYDEYGNAHNIDTIVTGSDGTFASGSKVVRSFEGDAASKAKGIATTITQTRYSDPGLSVKAGMTVTTINPANLDPNSNPLVEDVMIYIFDSTGQQVPTTHQHITAESGDYLSTGDAKKRTATTSYVDPQGNETVTSYTIESNCTYDAQHNISDRKSLSAIPILQRLTSFLASVSQYSAYNASGVAGQVTTASYNDDKFTTCIGVEVRQNTANAGQITHMIVTKYSARVAATDILSAINPVLTSRQ